MVDKSLIILLAKEAAVMVLNQAVEERKKSLLEKTAKLNEDYYNRVKEIVAAPASPVSPTPPPSASAHSHGGEEGCKTCGQTSFLRRVDNQVKPHDVAGGKDPHLDYTVRETAKHLALLQNHYTDYRCQNCISKHLLVIEGLAEEGLPMVKDPLEKQKFQEVKAWVKQAQGRDDWDNLVEESRQARLLLTGMEHVVDDDHNGV